MLSSIVRIYFLPSTKNVGNIGTFPAKSLFALLEVKVALWILNVEVLPESSTWISYQILSEGERLTSLNVVELSIYKNFLFLLVI